MSSGGLSGSGELTYLTFNGKRYTIPDMILSFSCDDTRALFAGQSVARFVNIAVVAQRKLAMLHRAVQLVDLRIPPNNRLEALKGHRKKQFSIRINDQWRICFRFEGGHAFDVEIVDYH
jgi:toxin HigB-1